MLSDEGSSELHGIRKLRCGTLCLFWVVFMCSGVRCIQSNVQGQVVENWVNNLRLSLTQSLNFVTVGLLIRG